MGVAWNSARIRQQSLGLGQVVVTHFGNIANNAFYNRRILREVGFRKQRKIVDVVTHAMSSPAWEVLDFDGDALESIDYPDWKSIPGATELINETMDARVTEPPRDHWYGEVCKYVRSAIISILKRVERAVYFGMKLVRRTLPIRRPLRSMKWFARGEAEYVKARAWAERMAVRSSRIKIKPTPEQFQPKIQICYGPGALYAETISKWPVVGLEHGTVRWITNGAPADLAMREKYRAFVETADHVWVTNLDDETLDNVEQFAPGRWSAFPHPHVLSLGRNRRDDFELRQRLLSETRSEFLVVKPSSWFWIEQHNKGALAAIDAFRACRDQGMAVGLVTMSWGGQVAEAQELFAKYGLSPYVKWLPPQSKKALQRFINSADVVWDQFGANGFGALALKTMELSVPLISRQISDRARDLIGEAPPFIGADGVDDLVRETTRLYELVQSQDGRDEIERIGQLGRSWMERRHHHRLIGQMQLDRYRQLTVLGHRPEALPNQWALMPDNLES